MNKSEFKSFIWSANANFVDVTSCFLIFLDTFIEGEGNTYSGPPGKPTDHPLRWHWWLCTGTSRHPYTSRTSEWGRTHGRHSSPPRSHPDSKWEKKLVLFRKTNHLHQLFPTATLHIYINGAHLSREMCDLRNKRDFNEQNRHYINEMGTFGSVKTWKHKDTVDSTGELINNSWQEALETIESFSHEGLPTCEICWCMPLDAALAPHTNTSIVSDTCDLVSRTHFFVK